jgi:tetratricopeptide (TPR) repeat protein
VRRRSFLANLAASGGVAAIPQVAFAETESQRSKLFRALRTARTEPEGRRAEHAIWQWWLDQAPTSEIRAAIDHGMQRRSSYDFEAAEEAFDKVVELAPDYAEGWNQRAFARFLRDNDSGALSDLEQTLRLEPDHFGALSGMYHVLMRMGRAKGAVSALARAVDIHPWIQERGLLPPDPDASRPPIKGKQQDL